MRIAKVPNRKNPETLLKIEKYVKYNIIFDGECLGYVWKAKDGKWSAYVLKTSEELFPISRSKKEAVRKVLQNYKLICLKKGTFSLDDCYWEWV